MKLDLDNPNVVEFDMSVDEARDLEIENDDLATAIDNAQGMVFTGEKSVAYVVIKISK